MLTLKKAHHRQLDIIQILYQNKEWHHFNELAEAVNASLYSVRDDLETIHSLFEEEITLIENKQTVRAEFAPDADLSVFQRYYYNQSLTYQLIQTLFFHPFMEIESIADLILTSRSTIYRIIPEINQQLKTHYEIELNTNPLAITGNELHIRQFFVDLFLSLNHPFEWPFEEVDEDPLDEMIHLMDDILSINLSVSQTRQLKYFASISIYRHQRRQYLSADYLVNPISTAISQVYPYLDVAKHTQHLKELLDIPISQSVLYDLFYPLFLLSRVKDLIDPQEYESIQSLLSEISQQTATPLPDDFGFINELVILKQQPILISLFQSNTKEQTKSYANFILNHYPDTYHLLEDLFETIVSDSFSLEQTNYLNAFILLMTTHWPALILPKVEDLTPVKAVIVSDISRPHAMLIEEQLKRYFGDRLIIEVTDETNFKQLFDQYSKDTLYVSTFNIPNPNDYYVINVRPLPTSETFQAIQSVIQEIQSSVVWI